MVAPYIYITRQHQFDLALNYLKNCKNIAVDTESSGFYTYESEICLIQISSGNEHYLIDTLCGLKLDALNDLFSSNRHTIIFHASASDITELRRIYPYEFKNIFDTFLSAKLLGLESCGLAALVEKFLGITMKKTEQKSNWKKRPLTESQLDYAHLDTVYLEALMEKMLPDVSAKETYPELLEELQRIIDESHPTGREFEADNWVSVPGALKLNAAKKGILCALYEYREARARRLNLAPFRIIGNQTLMNLVDSRPESIRALKEIEGLDARIVEKDGAYLLKLIADAPPLDDKDLPGKKDFDPVVDERFRKLRKWRESISQKKSLDPSLIVNNKALMKIAVRLPAGMDELRDMSVLHEKKLLRYGKEILEVIHSGKPA